MKKGKVYEVKSQPSPHSCTQKILAADALFIATDEKRTEFPPAGILFLHLRPLFLNGFDYLRGFTDATSLHLIGDWDFSSFSLSL